MHVADDFIISYARFCGQSLGWRPNPANMAPHRLNGAIENGQQPEGPADHPCTLIPIVPRLGHEYLEEGGVIELILYEQLEKPWGKGTVDRQVTSPRAQEIMLNA